MPLQSQLIVLKIANRSTVFPHDFSNSDSHFILPTFWAPQTTYSEIHVLAIANIHYLFPFSHAILTAYLKESI